MKDPLSADAPPSTPTNATFGWHFFALSKLRKTTYLK